MKVGAEGEGMVIGDTMNTASRVQSAAEPGAVFVDWSTDAAANRGGRLRGGGRAQTQGQGRAGLRFGALSAVIAGVPETRPSRRSSDEPPSGRH